MNVYEKDLGGRDPIAVLTEAPERIRAMVETMDEADLGRPWAPGKWSTAQMLSHLAQVEMVFGMRLRMALTTPNYVVQPFDQDKFMEREPVHSGRDAFQSYFVLRHWNLPLYSGLTDEERARAFTHPERGTMTVGELVAMLAGHELHHVAQIEQGSGK